MVSQNGQARVVVDASGVLDGQGVDIVMHNYIHQVDVVDNLRIHYNDNLHPLLTTMMLLVHTCNNFQIITNSN